MIISSFYNEETKSLVICTALGYVTKRFEEKDLNGTREVKIYNEKEELIGVNLLNYENSNLKSGIVNNKTIEGVIQEYFTEDVQDPYIVGYVKEIKKHPKSEKLNICQVDLKEEQVQIVCGAQNVSEAIKVIVSRVGATMPNGMLIKESKLIDEDSNGMITSLYELGLSPEKGQGIEILDDTLEIGTPYYG